MFIVFFFFLLQELENEDRPTFSQKLSQLTPEQKAHLLGRMQTKHESHQGRQRRSNRHANDNNLLAVPADNKKSDARRSRKRRSTEKVGASVVRGCFFSFFLQNRLHQILISKILLNFQRI